MATGQTKFPARSPKAIIGPGANCGQKIEVAVAIQICNFQPRVWDKGRCPVEYSRGFAKNPAPYLER